ncbi:MAG TPA: SGNH/GDSL hydrolase family protein [Chitinophagaceae bacterium]|nr:SGNH/GDSL hydrolase family protein [Chitinophagaceae bacterium]
MTVKSFIITFCSFPAIVIFSCVQDKYPLQMTDQTKAYSYLALGDSYTIGESVLTAENFPNQTVQRLKNQGYEFKSPEIVATTGWTTDELQNNINNRTFSAPYDIVTLLIGVNNQYRGRFIDTYKPEFENLLNQAIQFAGGKAGHVIVLSIPDWGVTPFAADRDRDQIAREIDEYNTANKTISEKYNVNYLDITPWTREAANDPSLVAADGLHPSAKEYKRWSEKLADKIIAIIQ